MLIKRFNCSQDLEGLKPPQVDASLHGLQPENLHKNRSNDIIPCKYQGATQICYICHIRCEFVILMLVSLFLYYRLSLLLMSLVPVQQLCID